MAHSYENSWEAPAKEFNFQGLLQSLLATDDAGQQALILKNGATRSYPFLVYMID